MARSTQLDPVKHGGYKAKFKWKKERIRGECDILGCKAKGHPGYRCKKHKKAVRKVQLKLNNIRWRKNVKEGKAGHHVVYTPMEEKQRLTKWARKDTASAEKVVKQEATIIDMETFKKLKKADAKPVKTAKAKAKPKPAAKPKAKTKARSRSGEARVIVPKKADGAPMMTTTVVS